jgi:hypothetical protein
MPDRLLGNPGPVESFRLDARWKRTVDLVYAGSVNIRKARGKLASNCPGARFGRKI